MTLAPVMLEDWMREFYFAADLDLGSSGVQDFSLADLRRHLPGLAQSDLDQVVFRDSHSLGGPRLRQAIANRWADGDAARVLATHGSSEATYLIMNTLLAPEDEVVVLDPCYPQLHLIARAIGCRVRQWRLRWSQGFAPDVGELSSLLGPRTRMVVVNFPHNPTGASLSAEHFDELLAAVARTGAYLVWDNAFGDLTYERPPLPNPAQRYERAISIGTLSKSFGLPGLRVGWCLASPQVLAKLIRLRDYITLHLSPLVELIAQRAIEGSAALLGLRLAQARANLALLSPWLERRQETLEWVRPQGGVCVFPRLPALEDTEALCRRLGNEQSVLLVPGRCFDRPQHVRLGFGGATPAFVEGLSRLALLVDDDAHGRPLAARLAAATAATAGSERASRSCKEVG